MARLDLYHHYAGRQVLEEILAEQEEQRTKLDQLRRLGERLMADTTKLLTDLAALKTAVDALIASQGASGQAAIDQADAQVVALTGQVQAATAAAITPPANP